MTGQLPPNGLESNFAFTTTVEGTRGHLRRSLAGRGGFLHLRRHGLGEKTQRAVDGQTGTRFRFEPIPFPGQAHVLPRLAVREGQVPFDPLDPISVAAPLLGLDKCLAHSAVVFQPLVRGRLASSKFGLDSRRQFVECFGWAGFTGWVSMLFGHASPSPREKYWLLG
jgi:hypothetical protein